MTLLKAREVELGRLTRLYAALSQVNQAIVVTKSRDELFKRVCRALVDHGGFLVAWIGWTDEETHRLVPVAVCGDDDGYLSRVSIYTDDRPEGRGPAGTAVREKRTCVSNDLLNDDAALPWRTYLREHTFRAAAVFPIRRAGEVCGALNVYADEVGFFQEKEVKLLEEAAGDLSFGLDNLDRETERRAAEERLRQERDFADAMLNSLPGVLYLYDQEGRFLRWNRNFEVATGRTGVEIASMHPLDFFAEVDKPRVAERIRDVFETGRSEIEAGLLSKDGSSTPHFLTGVVTRFAERTCLVGIGIDVSARVAADEARRFAEGRYQTLFEKAPDGLLIADPESYYLDANPSMCEMLGYTREQLIGLHASDIIFAEETPEIAKAISEIHGGRSHHKEWRFKRKDGTLFPVEVIATRLPDGNLLGMVRDITERRQAEKALRELNQSLEEKVAERTEQLLAAVTRAENADQLKSAFLATMSHELRTPLNSIIGFTGIVLQGLAGPLNAEQSKQLGMVRNSARHLLDLINDVLDISKIEAGQLEVRFESFDLPAMIARVVASMRPLADKKGLALTSVIDPDVSSLRSDRRRLEQILLNLVNNAIKFTERGSVTLTVDRIDESRLVRFRVRDTGIGIRPEDARKLFQPFRQIDTGLTRSHEGTGLGLAICRRLASLLGGDVSMTSEWGVGSEFVVTLPEGGSAGS